MTSMLDHFRAIVLQPHSSAALDPRLEISTSGSLATYYAPFEYINKQARLVIVGITPGLYQAQRALESVGACLRAGMTDIDALRQAKEAASFSGPMRSALVDMLDLVGVSSALGVISCSELFASATGLVHYTSALRNPVFVDGGNYTGNPQILRTPYLQSMADEWLVDEIRQLPNALWLPLGKEPTKVLRGYAARGLLASDRVLDGMPHPSGANAERVAYFLGRKPRHLLSAKTNAESIDYARAELERKVAACA
jgi:hypothetical protein